MRRDQLGPEIREPDQRIIDERIQSYYGGTFAEAERLTTRSAQGRLEFERTQELVRARLPEHARIVDIGGAAGIHAVALAAAGHEVCLIDPVPSQVDVARSHGTFEAIVGDARDLPFDDASFDAALLFGPLYHLADRADRLRALREATRVVRPGGTVFAAGIPRFVRHAAISLAKQPPQPYPPEWIAVLEHGLPDGAGRFPGGHYHSAEELSGELTEAGLTEITVYGVEGPAGLALEALAEVTEEVHQAALHVARAVAHLPGIRDMSNHVIAIGTV